MLQVVIYNDRLINWKNSTWNNILWLKKLIILWLKNDNSMIKKLIFLKHPQSKILQENLQTLWEWVLHNPMGHNMFSHTWTSTYAFMYFKPCFIYQTANQLQNFFRQKLIKITKKCKREDAQSQLNSWWRITTFMKYSFILLRGTKVKLLVS